MMPIMAARPLRISTVGRRPTHRHIAATSPSSKVGGSGRPEDLDLEGGALLPGASSGVARPPRGQEEVRPPRRRQVPGLPPRRNWKSNLRPASRRDVLP